VYCWSYCPQLRVYAGVLLLTAQLTKVDFIYPVMEYFPKKVCFFGKVSPQQSALAILRGNLFQEK